MGESKNCWMGDRNSTDTDQMLQSANSDVGLQFLFRPVCPNTKGTYSSLLQQGSSKAQHTSECQTFIFPILIFKKFYIIMTQQAKPRFQLAIIIQWAKYAAYLLTWLQIRRFFSTRNCRYFLYFFSKTYVMGTH